MNPQIILFSRLISFREMIFMVHFFLSHSTHRELMKIGNIIFDEMKNAELSFFHQLILPQNHQFAQAITGVRNNVKIMNCKKIPQIFFPLLPPITARYIPQQKNVCVNQRGISSAIICRLSFNSAFVKYLQKKSLFYTRSLYCYSVALEKDICAE